MKKLKSKRRSAGFVLGFAFPVSVLLAGSMIYLCLHL